MTQQLLIDEAWGKIPPATIKQYGYLGAVLYVSRDLSKCGTRTDVDALHAEGLGATWVFEDSAQRALGGYQAGVADGQYTLSYLKAVGLPQGKPVYAAVDFEVTPAQMPTVVAYLQGFTAGLGSYYQARAYGDAAVVDAMVAAGIPDDWQACAWSNGVVDGKAALYQRLRPVTGMPGSFDEDVVLGSLNAVGLWMPDPTPAPTAPGPSQEDDMLNPVYRVSDGPDEGFEFCDFGSGPVHIDGETSQALAEAKVPVLPVSGGTFAKIPGVVR